MERGKNADIVNAVKQIVLECTFQKVDISKMPMFDVEYIFLKIRSKSVGEISKLKLLCPDDKKTRVDVEIDLEKVDVQMPENHTNIVNLTKDIKLIMRYPCLKDMTGFDDKGEVSSLFDMIKRCVHEIHDGETVYNKVDISEKELDEFLSFDFFPRFGGGIGVTRMISALEKCGVAK